MPVFFTSLNSGSNGNCYYIGNETEAVLVDAGISCREIEKRMDSIDLSMGKVKAVFITHEHTDHICGLATLAKKFKLPVFITPETLANSRLRIDPAQVVDFSCSSTVEIGRLTITAFGKHHDACDPCSLIVQCDGFTIGVFTDLGIACKELVRHFQICHAAFLEANYDEVMLNTGKYPWHLKQRIRGGKGHLSNHQALAVFNAHRPPFMRHLLLSHLSKNNNRPELVQELFAPHAGAVTITVASRYEAMPVYCLEETMHKPVKKGVQMSLDFD